VTKNSYCTVYVNILTLAHRKINLTCLQKLRSLAQYPHQIPSIVLIYDEKYYCQYYCPSKQNLSFLMGYLVLSQYILFVSQGIRKPMWESKLKKQNNYAYLLLPSIS
jgi:hypothetical protein